MATLPSWLSENPDDVFEVKRTTVRNDTGITYGVTVGLRSFAEHAYEEGEDQRGVWDTRVEFGQTDATVAGGSAFVFAAREQDEVAEEIVRLVWGRR